MMKKTFLLPLALLISGRQGWRCKNALAGVFAPQKLCSLLLAGMLMAMSCILPPPPPEGGTISSGSDSGGQQTTQTQTPAQPTEDERLQQKLDAQEQARQQRAQGLQTTAEAQRNIAQISQNMVTIPGGSFTMGSSNPPGLNANLSHKVTLTGFRMGKYEVTQAQWTAVMGTKPSFFNGDNSGGGTGPRDPFLGTPSGEIQGNRPVEAVSWFDVLVFCNTLSMMEGLTPAYRIRGSTNPKDWGTVPGQDGYAENFIVWNAVEMVSGSTGYRLPTEAQWEYAARGGNGSPGNYLYAGSNKQDDVAWYIGNSGFNGTHNSWTAVTHEIGKKKPNGLGLYDMTGNISEICWDNHLAYTSGDKVDPIGPPHPSTGQYVGRVVRGGSYGGSDQGVGNDFSCMRNTSRNFQSPGNKNTSIGFRLVRPL